MGREIKRVPLDFDWPLNKVWYGFVSPYRGSKCEPCDGSGYNQETRQIADDFYAFDDRSRSWRASITVDEVQALLDGDRLWDLYWPWEPGGRKMPQPQKPKATQEMADKVNAANGAGRSPLGEFGHDAINRGILIEARAKRLGVWGYCKWCKGNGKLWSSTTAKRLSKTWREKKPPKGPGWQVWETVSEGSPISPVFSTPEELIEWLTQPGERRGYSRDAAENFVRGDGWVPSMITTGGKMYCDIEIAGMPKQ